MANPFTPYLYTKGGPALDAEFDRSPQFSKVRPGETHLFWKSGLRWYAISYASLTRIYRRINLSIGRLCAGGRTFQSDYLVLELQDGSELVLTVGDQVEKKAQALFAHLRQAHPAIQFGKED